MEDHRVQTKGVRHQKPSKTLGVYISDTMLEEVRESAAADNRSISSWIVMACREKLSREVSDTGKASEG